MSNTGEKTCTVIIQVFQETALQVSRVILKDVPKITGHLAVTVGRETECLLFKSPETECFMLEVVYLGHGLEMARHSIVAQGKDCTTDSYSDLEMHVILGATDKYLYYRETS